MEKKLYIVDRNGRMHTVEVDSTLIINGELFTTEERLEELLQDIWQRRVDLYVKNSRRLKVFDTAKLIGYQIVPVEE